MSKAKKIVVVLLSAGLVAVVSLFFYFWKTDAATAYRTATVERGDITETVNATGTVNAITTVQVGSQVSGIIAKLFVDFNSAVKAGQIVAQLDSTFLRTQVTEAAANVEKAQAAVNAAKRNLDRGRALFAQNLEAQADLDAALSAYESAAADVKQTQAALERARTNLEYSTIRSPIDGVVISRNVDVGQTVAASLQAPTLFTIANDLRKMMVETNLDEADIGKIREGQQATFTVDAFLTQPFVGKVTQIRLAPIIQQNVVTYNVIIGVNNPDLKLMPGMTANVSILVDRRENVLKIPNAALRFRPSLTQSEAGRPKLTSAGSRTAAPEGSDGRALNRRGKPEAASTNRATIWILTPQGKLQPVIIQTGITDGSFTEIIGGDLREGEPLIIGTQMQTLTPVGVPGMPGMTGGGRRGI